MTPDRRRPPRGGRALRHRNFRLFVAGHGVSVVGSFMTKLATGWLVYRLTGSPLLLGVVGFSGQFVSFVLGPFAGVWVERLDRRRMLVWTQAAAAAQSLTLAALTLAHVITLGEVVALAAVQGVINALDTPGRQAFLVQMVDGRDDLGDAIAITSAMTNGARLVGPAVAGIVIGAVGEGWCFLIDGVSYGAVIASLLRMRLPPPVAVRHATPMLGQMREGWDYVRTSRPTRTVLLLFAVLSLMGWPYAVLLPVFASRVLHGGPHTLGWLTGASAVGAVASAPSLTAWRRSVAGLARMIGVAAAVLGAGLVGFGLSRTPWVSLALMPVVGFGLMQAATAANTVIQSLVPEGMRARVMSYYTMAFFGTAPFGSLPAGGLAERVGVPRTVVVTGACCLAGSAWFAVQLRGVLADMRAAGDGPSLTPAPDVAPVVTGESEPAI